MAGYIGPIPVPQATQTRETFTATASQTTFNTAGYQPGYLDVFMNGVKLIDGSDYTATNGSDVVLSSGAAVNDLIEVVAYTAFEVLNQNFTGTTTVADLTVTGDLTVDGTTTTINSTTLNVDDINITVASGAADAAAANGAGLTVDGANATFNYASSGDKWTMNKDLDITGDLFVPSNNLLVGKTSIGNDVGAEFRSNGYSSFTRDGDNVFTVRRKTSDGDIVQFEKDTTVVGSIGTRAGRIKIGDGDVGLFFDDTNNRINPEGPSNTSANDNAIDLGGSSQRFKDLYLSNRVIAPTVASPDGTGILTLNNNGGGYFSRGVVVNEGGYDFDFRVESDNNSHFLFVDAANGHFGVNNSSPEVTADIQRNSSTGFSNTADQRSQMALTIRNGSEASGRYVGMNLIAGGGAQSDWSINNVWQSNYVGKLAFKTRTGANSTDWRQILAMTAGNEVVFNEDSTDIDFRVESNANTHMLYVDAGENHISINHDNPNAELDVKGEQVLRGKTNGGGITQMADSGVYTASTSATNIFQIYGLSNQSAEITIIYTDGSYRNGSFLQKIYISCHGSGTAPAGPNVIVENKSRAHNGTFPAHFTWTTSTSGSYVIFAATANTTIAGGGVIHVHVNSTSSTGGKSLEMLI